jgi:hypothetical protein
MAKNLTGLGDLSGLIIWGSQTQLSAQVTGFAFLLAMKAMFMFDIEADGHQNELKRLNPNESAIQNIAEQKTALFDKYATADAQAALTKIKDSFFSQIAWHGLQSSGAQI